jgi:hypothetical protein
MFWLWPGFGFLKAKAMAFRPSQSQNITSRKYFLLGLQWTLGASTGCFHLK